ncbi:hypothetical protein [uncultured Roseobacter sp.]|uniref:hypothetical protein n=1 Tax=uncultured Roseobacter sp. TaxID=114847 RepID=UPI002603610C|nr:hypothetical protein [uncultured Roseobacter sp.]
MVVLNEAEWLPPLGFVFAVANTTSAPPFAAAQKGSGKAQRVTPDVCCLIVIPHLGRLLNSRTTAAFSWY